MGKVRVTFALPASIWADTIHLVGDFNNWSTTTTPLQLEDRTWNVTLDLEPGRSFHYRYLINQTEWVNDWQTDALATSEGGTDNSVVITVLDDSESPFLELAAGRDDPRTRPRLRIIQGGLSDEKQAAS
jgi:1,4-alpha-glucan branching enzyme